MRLSTAGRKWLMNEEGLSLTAYPDPKLPPLADGSPNPAQKYSIGYGHSGAYRGQTITRAEAEALLVSDMAKYETAVSLTTPNASQAEFDAMVVLCYNIGTAGFAGSTVARLHNIGDKAGASRAFGMWRLSAGKINPVLVARRERERNVYLGRGYPGTTDWSPYAAPSPVATAPSAPGALSAAGLAPWAVGALCAAGAFWMLPQLGFARRALSIAS